MTGKTHQILGITAGISYFLYSQEPTYAPATAGAVLVFGYFSALMPDIDQPAAKIWDAIPFGRTISRLPNAFLDHRNLSHSLLGFLIFGFLIYKLLSLFPDYWGINTQVILAISLISYGSHLVADMLTVEGIPIFFPIQNMFGIPPHPVEGLRIMTGKWFENAVLFPVINLILLIIIITHWTSIHKILFR